MTHSWLAFQVVFLIYADYTYSNSVDLLSAYASSLLQNCSVFRTELHHFLKLSRKPLFVTLFNIDLRML